jgi:hypothetical protein
MNDDLVPKSDDSIGLGTPVTPHITFQSDTNTGMYYRGSSQISISASKHGPYKLIITFFGEDSYPKIVTWCENYSQPFNMRTQIHSFFEVRGKDKYGKYFEEGIPGRIEVYQIQKENVGSDKELKKIADIPGIMGRYCPMDTVIWDITAEKNRDKINRFDIQIEVKEGLELAEEIEKYREMKHA